MKKAECVAPSFGGKSFNCPHCGAFSHQGWYDVSERCNPYGYGQNVAFAIYVSTCSCCSQQCLWVGKKMLIPDSGEVSMPNEDLSEEVKADYMEAASVLQKSPRAAAALLRLALQKLCKQLGCKGKNIQQDIDMLVEKGLPKGVSEAMDSVRILGNEALHPGQIDMRDDTQTAALLFRLINFTAEKMLTDVKELKAFYATLPDSKKRNNRGGGESGNGD